MQKYKLYKTDAKLPDQITSTMVNSVINALKGVRSLGNGKAVEYRIKYT